LKIKFWQILCFLAIIIGVTLAVFPTKRILIPLYMEAGQFRKADEYLSDLLKNKPNNAGLLSLASRLYLLKGEPGRAIETLERALKQDPRNVSDLKKLAKLYEWDRNPKGAMGKWERITEIDPQEKKAWAKVADYNRYYGDAEKEASAIAKLISLEKKSPIKGALADPLSRMITRELGELTHDLDGKRDDPLLSYLLSHLYLIREQYRKAIREGHGEISEERADIILRCLEAFVRSDQIKRGERFAAALDKKEGGGIRNRIALVKVLRWNGLDTQALGVLAELHRIDPKDQKILLAMAKIGQEAGELKSAVYAYEQLIRDRPDSEDYRKKLASLYMGINDPRKACLMYMQLAKSTGGGAAYLDKMLKAASYTGDMTLQTEALDLAAALRPDDPAILLKRADLYLAQDQPKKAYPLFRKLATLSGQDKAGVQKVLEVAGYTGDRTIMKEAITQALERFPNDGTIIRKAGQMYLWMGNPKKAYPLYRKLAIRSKGSAKGVNRMIQVAGFTGNTDLMGEALSLGRRLRPKDLKLQLKLARFYLSQGEQKKAIVVYRGYLKGNPRDDKAQRQLAKLYLWTKQPAKALDQMQQLARMRPKDRSVQLEVARIAEQTGNLETSYRIYKKLYKEQPDDRSIQNKLIQLASWTNRLGEAAGILGNLSEKDPTSFEMALAAGSAYVEAGKVKRGVPFLERAMKIRPTDVSLRRDLVTYYGWVGPREKLISQLEYLDGRGLLQEKEHIILARAYLDQKDAVKALRHLEHLEKEERLPREEGIMLANAYELAKRPEAAVRVYRRLARENSENPKFLANLGTQALWLKRTDLALKFFESALRKDPKNLAALKGSAQAYARNNRSEKAIKRFRAYNRLNPNDYEVRYQLGELYFTNGRKGDAYKEYKKALRLIDKIKGLNRKVALGNDRR